MKLFRVFGAIALVLLAVLASCGDDDTTAPGDKTPPARVTNLSIFSTADSTLIIHWTAPGDDGHTGKAKSYDIRWSHTPITGSNFGAATVVANPPKPSTAGTLEQFSVTGLDTTLVTHIALRARDDAGNYSQVSNDAVFAPSGDATPPAQITDLAVVSSDNNSLTLQWTAPGDDGNAGTASSYEVRWSLSAINAGNFASATVAPNPPAPAVAGSAQQFTVTGLDTTLVTHFAMVARDDAANASPVSNDAAWSPRVGQHLVKDIPPFKDNSMYEESGDLSNGQLPYLFTGRTQGLPGAAVLRRALLAFAVSDSIPAGAVIDSVQLTMHVSKQRTATLHPTSLYRVTADWGEGASNSNDAGGAGGTAATNDVTWIYRFWNTSSWTTPGGDFVAAASATTSIGFGFNTWKSDQMKADVQSWLDTPANNFGWIMTGNESGTAGTAKRLDSRENSTAVNRPVLKVFYTVP